MVIAVSMISCLLLLINLSFKIVAVSGLVFTASSLLCPLITWFYLLALRQCSLAEQRHILNLSLMGVYIFSIGVYLLVNLPAAEYMHNNPVYQIVFEDIPKKFFATVFAFGVSFYLPHILFSRKRDSFFSSTKNAVLLAVFGGMSFFAVDFYFLFSVPRIQNFQLIFFDSFLICATLLLIIGVSYLAWSVSYGKDMKKKEKVAQKLPIFYYLVCIAVAILLICLACEYRLVTLNGQWTLTANGLLFPIALMSGTLIGELYGYRASILLTVILILAQLFFDALLMLAVALPSPDFFNLNPFYSIILPRRIPAATVALLIIFLSNGFLLDRLRRLPWLTSRAARMFIANFCARTLLVLVSYSLLFTGVYSYEQMLTLAFNAWVYKNIFELLILPLLVWVCHALEKRLQNEQDSSLSLTNTSKARSTIS